MKPDFDVAIVGGGMVGAGLAALLGVHRPTSNLRVALLEPRPAPVPAAGAPIDLRVSALSRASERLLRLTGAWPSVAVRGAAAYERMLVWDEQGAPDAPDALVFDAAELGEPDLGHIVENRSVQAALLERAVEQGVSLIRAGVESIELRENYHLTAGEGRQFTAGLVVAADGADSGVRRLAGIGTRGWEYGQHAVVAHLGPERPHGRTARQRFLSTGPLALLPLADGRVSLVWSTTPEMAAELTALDDAAFSERVTEGSASVLGRLQPTTPRVSFPLRLLHALEYTRPRLALVGDAAHTVHPLAGQGVNLGFMDVSALAQVIGEAVTAGRDPGEHAVLRRYERWRKAENLPAMALLDMLKRLFSNDHPMLSWARRGGLAAVERATPLKRALIERALGLGDRSGAVLSRSRGNA